MKSPKDAMRGPQSLPAPSPQADVSATPETHAERRARLQPVMDQLEAMDRGTFLDLCELVEMFSERMKQGMVRWTCGRVDVHIKQLRPAKKVKP